MKPLRHRPLARELLLIVAVKIVLIVALKLAFFSDPPRPDGAATARALLASEPAPTLSKGNPSHE